MSSIAFDFDFTPDYGVPVELEPGLRRVVAKNPNRFTFRGTGTYIVGTTSVAIIDPGPAIDSHFDALMDTIGGADVSHILITHTHRDHSLLAARVHDATGAPTIGFGPHGDVPPGDPDDQIDFGEVEDDDQEPDEQEDETQNEHADGGYDDQFVPDVAVRHGDIIVGDGWSMDCVHTPGHTSNHICFGWRERKALFSGDHVMGWSTSVISPPDGDMATYMASLELLLHRDDNVYWPTHGNPIRNPRDHVRAFISHRQAREAAIVELIKSGTTSIEQMVRSMYTQVHPKLYGAAARSVHAHIVHLVENGLLTSASGKNRLTDPYTLAT